MPTNAFNAAFNGDVPPFVMAPAKAANFYFFRDNGFRLSLLLQRATSSGSLQKAVNRRLKADPGRLINELLAGEFVLAKTELTWVNKAICEH